MTQAVAKVAAPAVMDEAAWLKRANDAFDGSTSYLDTNYRAQWEKNLRQFRSMHRTGSKYLSDSWKNKSKFFRPKTRAATRKAEAAAAAAFFSTADVVDITAMDDNNPKQLASAVFYKEVLNYRLTKSVPWFLTVMGAFQDTNVMGAVVSHQNWDFDEERPDVDLRPLENIRFDPGAKWTDPVNTSPYFIDMIPMYVHEVKGKVESAGWAVVADGDFSKAKCDMDSTRIIREGNRVDPKQGGDTSITDFDIVWVHRIIMRQGKEDVIYYTLGREKVLKEPVALKVAYPWLKKRKRPYVMGICVIETHRTMPSSPVELAAPVQDEINELVNQRRDNVAYILNKRFIVKRHAQVDIRSLTRGSPGSVTMANDPAGDIEKLEWTDVTGSSYQEEDRLNLDHDDLMGTFSGSSVASNRKLGETVGGMNLLSTEMNEIGDYTIKTFTESWFEPVLTQVLALEQFFEADQVIMALAGQRAGLIDKFGIDKITDDLLMQELTLEVNVGMGATNPLNSVERFMSGVRALNETFGESTGQKLSFEEVSSELFGKLGYKDGKRFLNNVDDPRVKELEALVAELQQKVAQKRSPELDAADAGLKRAQTVKTIIESVFGATQAAENIAAVPEIAPVADAVLQAAGYTAPETSTDPNLPAPEQAVIAPESPVNTSPLEPAVPVSPVVGVNDGIEGGEVAQ